MEKRRGSNCHCRRGDDGAFHGSEARVLCQMFDADFNYLFEPVEGKEAAT